MNFGTFIQILIIVLVIVSCWKLFIKAGQAGWKSIIPIYNVYILLVIAGKPWWWIILMLIPLVNFIVCIMLDIAIAKQFGKGAGFGVGLLLLPFIFFPILAFGDSQYQQPVSSPSAPTPPQPPISTTTV